MITYNETASKDQPSGRRHHDANQVFRLFLGRKIASMIRENPSILERAKDDIERMRRYPHFRKGIQIWEDLLAKGVAEVAARLSADDPESDYIRETMPCFVGLDEASMTDLVVRSRKAFKSETGTL